MRNPIVDQNQYKKPMKNPSYMKLMFSSMNDQTIEQVIACDAILAASLRKDKEAMKETGLRLADRFNYVNHGESIIFDTPRPINKWLNNPNLKTIDQDTDYVPNCN
jgi:hypothetical protein